MTGRQRREVAPQEVVPPPVRLRTLSVVRWGLALWLVALVLVLAVPGLRAGERSWWLWVPVSALVLGGMGYAYLARGRGNASDA